MTRDGNGNDYEQQQVSQWRLRELLQHEKDNAELRRQLVALEAESAALRQALRTKIEDLQKAADCLGCVGFNERTQLFFCRVCRYRDPLGPDGNKLHDDNCPWLALVNQFEAVVVWLATGGDAT